LQRDPDRIIGGCDQLELTAHQGVRELEIAQRFDGKSTRSDVSHIKQRSDQSAGRRLHPLRPLGIGEIRHASQKVVIHVASNHDSTDDQALESDGAWLGLGHAGNDRSTDRHSPPGAPAIGGAPGPLTDGVVRDMLAPMAQLSVRLSTGEQYYIELKPEDGQPETQLQNFLNEEPPFRQDWLETTTGRYVRMSTLVSVELLTLDPDDPRLTS
jgi:hypothetical protein